MITSKVKYLGNLRTECEHVKSGSKIVTDAPTDNHGKGESFSPTDLVATSLAACMTTIIGIFCETNGYNFKYAESEVTKIMASNPRRIEKIIVNIDLSKNDWDKETQRKVEIAARACPVAKTLNGNVQMEINFQF